MNQDTREQPVPIEPRTTAGRALLEHLPVMVGYVHPIDGRREDLRGRILAIEREAVERAVHDRGADPAPMESAAMPGEDPTPDDLALRKAIDATDDPYYDDDYAKEERAAFRRDIAQLGDTPRPSGLPLARRAVHDRGADPLREATQRIAALGEDDVRDYEQGLCFFCGASSEPIPGPRGGTSGHRKQKPIHEPTCSYLALRAALGEEPQRLDEAWAAAEAALPEDWRLELSAHRDGNPEAFYTASASYAYSLRHYRLNVGKARWAPFEMTHGPTPAVALHKLADALAGRTE